jgi:hypothetical protein
VNKKKVEGEGDKEEERKKKKMEEEEAEEEVRQECRNLDSKCIQTGRHNPTLVRVISA